MISLRESGYQVHRLATELIPAYFSTIPPTVKRKDNEDEIKIIELMIPAYFSTIPPT